MWRLAVAVAAAAAAAAAPPEDDEDDERRRRRRLCLGATVKGSGLRSCLSLLSCNGSEQDEVARPLPEPRFGAGADHAGAITKSSSRRIPAAFQPLSTSCRR
jgi:hypothetical protein